MPTGVGTAAASSCASGLRASVEAVCGTVGARVRVTLPGGDVLIGTATGLDGDGRIVVRQDGSAEPHRVAAGDVEHLRYE